MGSAEAAAALLVLYCTWSDSCFWWGHYLFVLWQPHGGSLVISLQPVPWQSCTAAVAVSDFLMLGFSKSKLVTDVIHKPPCSLTSYSTFQCQIVSCNKCCGFCVPDHSIFLISELFDAHFPSCSNLLMSTMFLLKMLVVFDLSENWTPFCKLYHAYESVSNLTFCCWIFRYCEYVVVPLFLSDLNTVIHKLLYCSQ